MRKIFDTFTLGCWTYNLAYICEGHGSKMNVVGLVCGSIYLLGRLLYFVTAARRRASREP